MIFGVIRGVQCGGARDGYGRGAQRTPWILAPSRVVTTRFVVQKTIKKGRVLGGTVRGVGVRYGAWRVRGGDAGAVWLYGGMVPHPSLTVAPIGCTHHTLDRTHQAYTLPK